MVVYSNVILVGSCLHCFEISREAIVQSIYAVSGICDQLWNCWVNHYMPVLKSLLATVSEASEFYIGSYRVH